MRRTEAIAILLAVVALAYSGREALELRAEARGDRDRIAGITAESALTAKVIEAAAGLPAMSADTAEAITPDLLMRRAEQRGLRVSSIVAEGGGLRVVISGAPAPLLRMLGREVVSARLVPGERLGEIAVEAVYGGAVGGEGKMTAAEVMAMLAAVKERGAGVSAGVTVGSVRARAGKIEVAKLFLREDGVAPVMARMAAIPGEAAPSAVTASGTGIEYLGVIAGGALGREGVFREASTGLVVSARAGEKVAGWRIVSVGEERAVVRLAEGGGEGGEGGEDVVVGR